MFTRPLNRGCYQPWSRCMFSFTCTGIQFHIHTYARTKSFFRTLAHTLTPSPEWPSRRACLCQQMSGRRCVFLCLLRHSFHPPLQRLPICLWPCFISAHSSPPPRGRQRVCCITGTGVESTNTFSQRYCSAPVQPLRLNLSDLDLEVTRRLSLMR